MADSEPPRTQPLSSGALIAIVVAGFLLWPHVEKLSQFTQLFVDRAAATEACLMAGNMNNNLPPLPRTDGGLVDYFGSSANATQARAAREAERRSREIQMRAAAERSRDQQLRQAAAQDAESVLAVCRQKSYPR
jgi:hypothetical protein